MIDIHSHTLPGVDDGAQNLDDALKLLHMAVENGITTQVLTPHIRPPRYMNDPNHLYQAFLEFSQLVKAEQIPITLHLSAEVRIGPEVIPLVQRNDFPWLGIWQGKRAFLLEMPHHQVPLGSINLVKWLIKRNMLPIIAHPERNRDFQYNQDKLSPFIEAGCKLQITAASLTGKFGKQAIKTATDILVSGDVLLMASDCHNSFHRPPDLNSGVEIATQIIGAKQATALVEKNPAQLLNQRAMIAAIA